MEHHELMKKIEIEQMKRHEVIWELKKYVRPTQHFHPILNWPTKYIVKLLLWYKECEKEGYGVSISRVGFAILNEQAYGK